MLKQLPAPAVALAAKAGSLLSHQDLRAARSISCARRKRQTYYTSTSQRTGPASMSRRPRPIQPRPLAHPNEINRLGGPASHGCIRLHPANATPHLDKIHELPPGFYLSFAQERYARSAIAAGARLMGMLMIRCPMSGQPIFTGGYIESAAFRSTPVFFSRTHCPLCHAMHEWSRVSPA